LAGGVGVVVVVVLALVGLKLVGGSSSTPDTGGAATTVPADPGGNQGGRGRGAAGTIASIDGGTFTLSNPNGSTKVVTGPETTFTATSAGALADIKVGDNLAVQGTTTGTTVAADRITDTGTVAAGRGGGFGGNAGGPPPSGQAPPPGQGTNGPNRPGGGRGRPVVGTVSARDGSTVSLTGADGSALSVTTTASTTVSLVKASSLSALRVGQTVRVSGGLGALAPISQRS